MLNLLGTFLGLIEQLYADFDQYLYKLTVPIIQEEINKTHTGIYEQDTNLAMSEDGYCSF